MQLFEKFGQNSKGVVFKRGMENMLGKRDGDGGSMDHAAGTGGLVLGGCLTTPKVLFEEGQVGITCDEPILKLFTEIHRALSPGNELP